MSDIIIRLATPADFDAIYDFVCDLENERFNKELLKPCYEICLIGEYNHYLVAMVNERAIGYISCHGQVLMHHGGLVYEIQELYVVPEYRSKGVGALLIDALMKIINQKNFVLLEVSSNVKRKDAHRFYESNGFLHTSYKFKKGQA